MTTDPTPTDAAGRAADDDEARYQRMDRLRDALNAIAEYAAGVTAGGRYVPGEDEIRSALTTIATMTANALADAALPAPAAGEEGGA